jgi:hypothetical protein
MLVEIYPRLITEVPDMTAPLCRKTTWEQEQEQQYGNRSMAHEKHVGMKLYQTPGKGGNG